MQKKKLSENLGGFNASSQMYWISITACFAQKATFV